MTAKRPVAYRRRSKVEAASPGDVSRDTQMNAIRARAGIDGHNGDMLVLEDWGKSGRRAKVAKRTEYGRLLAMVERGEVSTIYAYNWSRLGRSTRDLLALADLCRDHDTAIVTATSQSVDPSSADGRMLLTILTAVDEWQAEVQAERTAGTLAAWREAHPDEKLGRKSLRGGPGPTGGGRERGPARVPADRYLPWRSQDAHSHERSDTAGQANMGHANGLAHRAS